MKLAAPEGTGGQPALAHHAEWSRLTELGRIERVEVRSGQGWLAIRSGLDSNDLNGVVSAPGRLPDAAQMAALGFWFGELPATWHLRTPDGSFPGLAAEAGWRPEGSARCAGRQLPLTPDAPAGITVRRVTTDVDLTAWLDVAEACGWFDAGERQSRGALARALPWPRWIASRDDEPVGMATGWRDRAVAELVDVAVLPTARRAGVGSALVGAVADWAGASGQLVAAPSPDGWGLLRALGFANRPALPDVVAYWPGATGEGGADRPTAARSPAALPVRATNHRSS